MGATFRLDSREVERGLRRLAHGELGRVLAGGLNRTGFEILDAEKDHIASVFDFAGPSTRKFTTGGIRFNKARPGRLFIKVFPLKKSESILSDHVTGAAFTAEDGDRLGFDGKLAIPVNVFRGRSGKVPKRHKPQELVKRGAFLSKRGRALLGRKTKRGPVEVLYALVPRARVKPTIRFVETAFETARRELPRKIRREFEKLKLR